MENNPNALDELLLKLKTDEEFSRMVETEEMKAFLKVLSIDLGEEKYDDFAERLHGVLSESFRGGYEVGRKGYLEKTFQHNEMVGAKYGQKHNYEQFYGKPILHVQHSGNEEISPLVLATVESDKGYPVTIYIHKEDIISL